MKITYLGPSGVTFSAIAFYRMVEAFGVQDRVVGAEEALAARNDDIVPLVAEHHGWGAIAMETLSTGRVDPPVNSFIELLDAHDNESCPIGVVGALRMTINFVLMALPGLSLQRLEGVRGHAKAIGACKGNVDRLGVPILEADSNGQAAEDVALNPKFSMYGALAPMEAAVKYGLEVLSPAFEDKEAVTTFFLLGPRGWNVTSCKQQQSLLVFGLEHHPLALVNALSPFGESGMDLTYIPRCIPAMVTTTSQPWCRLVLAKPMTTLVPWLKPAMASG